MTRRALRLLWVVSPLVVAVSITATASALRPSSEPRWWLPVPEPVQSFSADASMLQASAVAESDPFRVDRRPAPLPFGTVPEESRPIAPLGERPPTVSGLLGPPWRAVLEGVPRREGGVLVGQGDTISGWQILSITTDAVVVRTRDTTWAVPVRKP